MKKIVGISILTVLLLLTSACGTKKLVCTQKGSDIGKKTETTLEVFFDGKKVSKVKEKIEITFEEEYKDSIDSYYKALNENYKDGPLEEGIDVKVTKGDDNICVDLNIDMKKQTDESNAGNVVDASAERSEIKKSLEDSGYTCK